VRGCSAFDSVFDEQPEKRAARLAERKLPHSTTEPLFAAHYCSSIPEINAALAERNLLTVVHCDSAVCGPLAEGFGLPAGSIKPGQIVTALHRLGFRHVYSNTFAAALSVLEQAKEIAERVQKGGNLPVISSSCPAAVRYIEQSFPELIHFLSGCRSPRQIAGSLSKTYLAKQFNVNPAYLFAVTLASCTAHKLEATRVELRTGERRDIDAVLTGRELALMLKHEGIEPALLEESQFDQELMPIDGMQNVFCQTGDLARAVLETTSQLLSEGAATVELLAADSEEASTFKVQIGDHEYVAASVSGLKNAMPFLEEVQKGRSPFRFLELMACPQGCVSGAGQPKILLPQNSESIYADRAKLTASATGKLETDLTGHPAIDLLYKDVWGVSCGDKFNHVLQTSYVDRSLDSKPVRSGDL
jgi:iron only hydrogenase large subunit-like protein